MPSRRILIAVVLLLVLGALTPAASSAANLSASFTKRLGVNEYGDIAVVGNSLLTCQAGTACTSALDAALTTPASGFANNDFTMRNVDVDSDASTFNSSGATLTLPSEAQVIFAGLYWSGRTTTGSGGAAPPAVANKKTVKFATPGSSAYATVTAPGTAWTTNDAYQHFADVTSLVRAAGTGVYRVANVQAATGADRYAGWSLVVAYSDPDSIPRNLTIFDGIAGINSGDSVEITASGFTTTTSGAVRTSLGVVAYEGDMGIGGDSFKLQGTTLSDAVNPATDFFNSSVSVRGARVLTGRDPAVRNHLGVDIDVLNADGILANGATSAKATVSSTGEAIFPGVLTMASQLLAPKIRPVTVATDLNGGLVSPGDIIEYVVTAKNIGNDTANGVTLTSTLPEGVELLDGTLELVQDQITGTQTPGAGDDRATWDAASRTITWRIGSGASSATGGSVAEAGEVVLRYRVRIGAVADGATLTAAQLSDLRSATTSDPYQVAGRGGTLTVSSPDVRMQIARTGSLVRGAASSYALTVSNSGAIPTTGTVRVTDVLPAGQDLDGAPSGTGWTCGVVARTITCERSDALAVGASWPAITVPVRTRQDATGAVAHTAAVAAPGDGVSANDSASDSATPTSRSGVSVALAASPASIAPGDTTTVTATIANSGPSDATAVVATLPVPSGMELVSTSVPGGAVGTIPAGGSALVSWTLRARRGAAGTTQTPSVSVTTTATDTTSGDDAASAAVTVARRSLVSVTAAIDPDPPVVGSPLRLRMTVRNDGPTTATGVVLTHTVPAQLHGAVATIDPALGTCAITAGTLRCTLEPLADAEEVRIDLDGTVAATAGGAHLDLRAAVAPVADDPDHTDDEARIATVVRAAADLRVSAVQAPATLRAGEHAAWVLRVADAGPGDAGTVMLRTTLPAGLSLVDHGGADCTAEGSNVTCLVGAIPAGGARDVRLGLAAGTGADAGTVSFTAAATADEPDPTPADAAAAVSVAVTREADLAVGWLPRTDLVAGTPARFTAVVADRGPADARDVTVAVTVPADLISPSVAVRGRAGTCTLAARVATCTVARIAVGDRVLVDVAGTLPADAGRAFEARIAVASADADPVSTNDSARTASTSIAVHDIVVGAEAPAGRIVAGTRAPLTLTVRNDGPSDSAALTLTQVLPVGATAVSLDPRCEQHGRTVSCRLDGLAAGAGQRIALVVRSSRLMTGASLASAAAVSAAGGTDPQLGNNTLDPVADLGCTSRRQVRMRLRVPSRARLRSVAVSVHGHAVPVRTGKRLTAVVDLRGRPAGRFLVRIRAVTRSGRHIEGTRAYQTCTPKRASGRLPRV